MNVSVRSNQIKLSQKIGKFKRYFKQNWQLYAFLVPGLLFTLVFKYIPMLGNVIAFNEYDIFSTDGPILGMFTSPWVGFEHFRTLFSNMDVLNVFKNTILISLYKIFWLQPVPIILAILINEVRCKYFQKTVQTIYYLPHFLSWVIVSGLFLQMLGPYGPINGFLESIGIIDQPIQFFQESSFFRSIMVITGGWKEVGWNTIVYLAALTSIDPELYEAAKIDGANKFKQIIYVTIPSISSTILMLFTIRLGHIFDAGFDQVFNTYNPLVYDTGDIIGTYVYRIGIGQMNYSFSAAVAVFEAIIGLTILFAANKICRKYFGKGIW
ncbi:ABC transporter permease subunit [Clostridium sp.]|uniref:ABC transporter permease n=1 Tax=Clostridium sp. TaxID=1506 RepID=UPI001D2ED317|nr:ABC transporter permease subunit [Clostridium sp.]MBS5987551.1 sugar ABC transporter permease [Clostridium sp.]